MALHRNFINGEWLEGKGVRENLNPSDLSDIVGEYAQADKAQTEAAIAAAKAAQPAWAAATPQVSADALEFIGTELLARKDEIGRLLSREEGKPMLVPVFNEEETVRDLLDHVLAVPVDKVASS